MHFSSEVEITVQQTA